MAQKKKRTKAAKADPYSPGAIEMLEAHAREQYVDRIAKGKPEPLLSPFMTSEDPKKWIEESSKATGVRTDTGKESKDLTRRADEAEKDFIIRANEARKETEELLGITRGFPKKKKK